MAKAPRIEIGGRRTVRSFSAQCGVAQTAISGDRLGFSRIYRESKFRTVRSFAEPFGVGLTQDGLHSR